MSFLESIQDGLLEREKEEEKDIYMIEGTKYPKDYLNESYHEEEKTCLHFYSLNLIQ